jgi:hypothetical protein
VISRGRSHHSSRCFFLGERKNGVRGSPHFERAGDLQVFTFEKKLGAGNIVQGFRSEDRSAVNVWGDAALRFANIVQIRPEIFVQRRLS